MVRPPLLWWLEDHGFDRHRDITFIHEARGFALAKCTAIRKAIESECDIAVFCEADAIPSAAATDSFFRENRYHVQCVKYDTENGHAFNRYDAFHSLIWRASRESLVKMAEQASKESKPLCWIETTQMGDETKACSCQSIAGLAKRAGLSTGWIGNAGHVPKTGSIVPRVVTYGP